MTFDEFLGHLAGVRPQGKDKAMAVCPAHEDRNPSLSVARGDDGKILIRCHAGCETHDICKALGLKTRDLFPPKATPAEGARRPPTPRGRIVAEYNYTDEAGTPLFQVVRFEPKDFRQRRPDGKGSWIWNLNGVPRVLYRLPGLLATEPGATVFVVEGEKDADNLVRLGFVATTCPGGAGKWGKLSTDSALHGRSVMILPDKDTPGREHGRQVAAALRGKTTEIRILELPGPGKDVSHWIEAGGTAEQLLGLVEAAPRYVSSADEPAPASGKPRVLLPGGAMSIQESGENFAKLLATTNRYFVRGGVVVEMTTDDRGTPNLNPIKPAAMASDLESVSKPTAIAKIGGQAVEVDATCTEQTAKLIMNADTFLSALPPIRVLSPCPALIERDGKLVQVSSYDRQSGILALGEPALEVPLDDALAILHDLLDGFNFVTPSDRSRALAAIITPALVFGGLLQGRAPVDLGEADNSQTGKGYRNKLTAAVYRGKVRMVTQRKGGVGSLEESFDAALIQGANFIGIDNVRGTIDSPAIESFLTEDTYFARIPYLGSVEIDPRRVIVQMTSNKADITRDFANRASCVRILKQPEGYQFRSYPEGGILEHVRANQPLYLGAVFAVEKAWHDAGKPRTDERRHDFCVWAQTLDWIVQNIFHAAPLLDGHRDAQTRMATPALNWLRDVALAVAKDGKAERWLRTNVLVDVMAYAGVEVPGLGEGGELGDDDTRKMVLQSVGRKLARCFDGDDVRAVDGIRVRRRATLDDAARPTKEYLFDNIPSGTCDSAARPLCSPYASAKEPAKETRVSAMPANGNEVSCYGASASTCSDDCNEHGDLLRGVRGNSGNCGNDSGDHSGAIEGVTADSDGTIDVGEDGEEVVEWRA